MHKKWNKYIEKIHITIRIILRKCGFCLINNNHILKYFKLILKEHGEVELIITLLIFIIVIYYYKHKYIML